jgi:hypothetical protein
MSISTGRWTAREANDRAAASSLRAGGRRRYDPSMRARWPLPVLARLTLACLPLACSDGSTATTAGGSSATETTATDATETGDVIECNKALDMESCAAANEDGPIDGPRCAWLSLSRVSGGACRIEAAGEACFQVDLDEGGPGCDPQFRTNEDMSVDVFAPADCALILEPGWERCGVGNDDPPAACACFS